MANSTFKLGYLYRLNPLASGTGFFSLEADLPDPNMAIIRVNSKVFPESKKNWYLDTSIIPTDLSSLTLVKHENINGELIVTLRI